jgi:hypothetical protein
VYPPLSWAPAAEAVRFSLLERDLSDFRRVGLRQRMSNALEPPYRVELDRHGRSEACGMQFWTKPLRENNIDEG